jgi:hypothetical protein
MNFRRLQISRAGGLGARTMALAIALVVVLMASAGCSDSKHGSAAASHSTTTAAAHGMAALASQGAQFVSQVHAAIPGVGPSSGSALQAARQPLTQALAGLGQVINSLSGLTAKSNAAQQLSGALTQYRQIVATLVAGGSASATLVSTARAQLQAADVQWRAALDAVQRETGAQVPGGDATLSAPPPPAGLAGPTTTFTPPPTTVKKR